MRVKDPSPTKQQRAAWGFIAAVIIVAGGTGAWLYSLRPSAVPAQQAAKNQPPPQEDQLRAAIRASPESPQPRQALVELLTNEGRFHDALDVAKDAAEAFPADQGVHLGLAGALDATGQTDQGIKILRSFAGGGPVFRVREAALLVKSGRPEEAARILDKLPRVSADLALLAGQIYLDARQPERAVPFFKQAAEGSSDHGDGLTHYGFALLASGEYVRAAEVLDRALQHSPEEPTLNYYSGAAMRLSGDKARLPEAETRLQKAVVAVPGDAHFQYEFALARVQLRDLRAARAAMLEAAELQPEMAEIQRDLARIHERLDQPQEAALAQARYLRLLDDAPAAVRVLDPLFAADPTESTLGLALSEALYDAGNFTRATQILTTLGKKSDDIQILWHRLRLQNALGDYHAALKTVDALAAAEATEPDLSEARVTVYQRLSRYPDAEALLQKMRNVEPDNAVRHYRLGQALSLWSQRSDAKTLAEASLRRAVELRSNYPEARYELGNVLLATGRPKEAVEQLRRALDAAPRYRNALRSLGRAYARLGDQERSAEAFALLKRAQALEDERTRLELPIRQLRNVRAGRAALVDFHLRTGALHHASRELEMLTHQAPDDPGPHRLLLGLYGHDRRFQRQFEERAWLRQHGATGTGQ
ncbi:MAG: hypothetical protein K0Q72_2134 [Armatimonadetes bacterium]|jgi:predicted Zn-dependent protease|nr:hypothetical protein [Armatimonadota bacterium]